MYGSGGIGFIGGWEPHNLYGGKCQENVAKRSIASPKGAGRYLVQFRTCNVMLCPCWVGKLPTAHGTSYSLHSVFVFFFFHVVCGPKYATLYYFIFRGNDLQQANFRAAK